MSNFKRARTDDQKSQRMEELKKVTSKLFKARPYHEITISTIGEKIGWTRPNIYKYVSTKEEIFLMLAADARDEYVKALLDAFSSETGLRKDEIAQKWARICDKNKDWSIYGSILIMIVEENVSLESLKEFKKGYYDHLETLKEEISSALGVSKEDFATLFTTIHYHACGLTGFCSTNKLAQRAIKELGIKRTDVDFEKEMEIFILMCLNFYSKN